MNEEQMRKEFEEWFSSVGFSIESIKATKEQFDAFNSYSWQIWQASRQAMKPIKLPDEIEIDLLGDQVAPTHQNSYAEGYNDALSDLELKITELGYKVEL